MFDLSNLTDLEEIKVLKSRYFHYVDGKAWGRLRSEVFVHDSQFHLPEAIVSGVDAFLARISPVLDVATSVHRGHMPEIIFESSDRATGRWLMDDEIRWPADKPFKRKFTLLRGTGHYYETYVRTAEGWRIKALRLTRTFVDLS
jgi:hypothetical protein